MLSNPSNQQENGKDSSSLTHSTLSNNNIFKEMNLNNNQNVLQKRNNATNTKRPTKKELKESYCCCGSIRLQYFVIGITIVELVFYGYQVKFFIIFNLFNKILVGHLSL
jgi:hypothetical protein